MEFTISENTELVLEDLQSIQEVLYEDKELEDMFFGTCLDMAFGTCIEANLDFRNKGES